MFVTDQSPGARGICLAQAAGRMAGVDVSDASLIRARSSVHVDLPRAGIVARVEAPGANRLAERQVRIARFLAEQGAPVARLAPIAQKPALPRLSRPDPQPYLVEDGAVTLWQRLDRIADPGPEALGQAVRALHDATRNSLPADLPACNPLSIVHSDLDWASPWTGSEESEELRRRADALAEEWQWARRHDPLGRVIVHGDLHQDNSIVTEQGLILLDLEDAGKGPASWDFAVLRVGVQHYGVPEADYRAFVAGYGSEPGAWEGLAIMCRIYELLAAAWAMRCSADTQEMAREASVRVGTVLGRGDETWTLK